MRLMPLELVTFELTDGKQKICFFTISRRSPLTLDPDSARGCSFFALATLFHSRDAHTKSCHQTPNKIAILWRDTSIELNYIWFFLTLRFKRCNIIIINSMCLDFI
jgi:hypothetical protein